MMVNSKYKNIFIVAFGAALIAGLLALIWFMPAQKATDTPVVDDTQYLVTNLGDGWSRYTDIPYAFSIDFPSANGERPFAEMHSPGNYPDFYSVGFRAQAGDMGTFGIMVIPRGFADAEQWFADRQKNDHQFSEHVLERRVQIAGQEALVTYWRETPENEQPYENRERSTAFSRNGIVYIIGTRGMSLTDTVRAWESFRFVEPDFANPPVLIDGRKYYPGVYHATSAVNGTKSYHSERFGVSLDYPEDYLLFENEVEGGPQARYGFVAGSIVLGQDLPVRQSIVRAEAGHGGGAPPGIALTFYLKQDQSLSLEEWLRTNPSGNFNPDVDPDAERSLVSATIGGLPAFRYHSDFGMYATDYAAFAYGNWFVLANAPDDTRQDFDAVLGSIRLR